MKRIRIRKKGQAGLFLLEALVSILIFSLGILGLVAMGSTAISAQSDAQYRTEASAFASDIASRIALNVNPLDVAGSLPNFQSMATIAGHCNFAGNVGTNPIVADWLQRVTGAAAGVNGLPGAVATKQSIFVETEAAIPGSHNRVTITVCWKPKDTPYGLEGWHEHKLVTYVNL